MLIINGTIDRKSIIDKLERGGYSVFCVGGCLSPDLGTIDGETFCTNAPIFDKIGLIRANLVKILQSTGVDKQLIDRTLDYVYEIEEEAKND